MIQIAGVILLCVGFGGGALEDWKTGKVDGRWLVPSILGASLLWSSSFLPGLNTLFGAVLLGFGATMWYFKQLGGGDILPMGLLGFSLGLWAIVALLVYVSGSVVFLLRTKSKKGPAMPFLALGLLVGLMGMGS